MRVRSFRNTVLSFSILRLQRYCKAAGKQREGSFLGGGRTGRTGGLIGEPLHIRFHRISCFVHYAYRYLHNLMDRTMNADYICTRKAGLGYIFLLSDRFNTLLSLQEL